MKLVRVYSSPYCPFAQMARSLLKRKGVPYEFVDVSRPAERARIGERSGWPTVPIIYIGEELVGGFRELRALEDSGKLDAMLRAESDPRSNGRDARGRP